jgi:hypothetical protein
VLHRYANIESFQEHFANLAHIREELLAVCEISAEIYGNFSADALTNLARTGAKVFAPFQGFNR